MNISEFVNKYNFHDSLFEEIIHKESRYVQCIIDFCYWKQKDFVVGNAETGLIKVVFHDISYFSCDIESFHSDTIIDMILVDGMILFQIETEAGDYREIKIKATTVSIDWDV